MYKYENDIQASIHIYIHQKHTKMHMICSVVHLYAMHEIFLQDFQIFQIFMDFSDLRMMHDANMQNYMHEPI